MTHKPRTTSDRLSIPCPGWAGFAALFLGASLCISTASAQATDHAENLQIAQEGQKATGATLSDSGQELLHLESDLNLTTQKFDAHSRLSQLSEAHPNDPKILFDLGMAEERLGRWHQSLDLYNRSLEIAPDAVGRVQAKSYLHAAQGPHARLDQFYRDTSNDEIQWITRAHAREFVANKYTVGATYEHRFVNDNTVRQRFDGSLDRFDGSRGQWDIFAERAHDFSATRLSLLGQEDKVGAGLSHRRQLPFGEVLLKGVYREPYWVFVEGIADEGVADRLQALWQYDGHSHFGGPFKGSSPITGSFGISLNRYGLGSDSNVAESFELLANLRYRFLNSIPGLSVGYEYDAEYANLTASRTDINGNSFRPIPLETTEVHSLDVSWSNDFWNNFHYDLTTGYSFDTRIDSNGPFVYFSLIYDTWKNLQMGLNVQFSQENNRGIDSTFTQSGVFLLWRL